MRKRALDASVARALAVHLPPALAEGIMEEVPRRDRFRRRMLLAAMGSLAAIAALGAGFACRERDDPIALACIDFVVEEESNAILAASNADTDALYRAIALLRIDLARQVGSIRYIGQCVIHAAVAYHLIASTPQGKVTLLLLPERAVDRRRTAAARGLLASLVPAGSGTLVLIGNSPRSLERVEQMVLRR